MSDFVKMSEYEREQWWTSVVTSMQAGMQTVDEKSKNELDGFLYEVREKLLGY